MIRLLVLAASLAASACYAPDLPACAPDCDAELDLIVDGHGKLVVEPLDVECKSGRGDDGKRCDFEAQVGLDLVVTAVDQGDDRFVGWTTGNCDGQDEQCVLVVESPETVVGARFTNERDD